MGFKNFSVDDLVELGNHDVSPRFFREMREKYGKDLPLEQLRDMRIHGVEEVLNNR